MNLHTAYFALYVLVPIAGIALNSYVLWRLIRIARWVISLASYS